MEKDNKYILISIGICIFGVVLFIPKLLTLDIQNKCIDFLLIPFLIAWIWITITIPFKFIKEREKEQAIQEYIKQQGGDNGK